MLLLLKDPLRHHSVFRLVGVSADYIQVWLEREEREEKKTPTEVAVPILSRTYKPRLYFIHLCVYLCEYLGLKSRGDIPGYLSTVNASSALHYTPPLYPRLKLAT